MKCRNCKEKFEPKKFNWKYCDKNECHNIGVKDIVSKVRLQEKKRQRKETKEAKVKLKTRSDWLKELQTVFNKFIRIRDKDLPCISCGKNNDKQYHAGHYRSVGSCPELRFNEMNVRKQCATCNTYLHGNLIEYRISLVKLIGVDKVEFLESNHEPLKLSIPEIQEEIKRYKAKIKLLT